MLRNLQKICRKIDIVKESCDYFNINLDNSFQTYMYMEKAVHNIFIKL